MNRRRRALLTGILALALTSTVLYPADEAALHQSPRDNEPISRQFPASKSEKLESELLKRAAKRGLTSQVINLFFQYSEARAKEKLAPGTVPDDFWKWLAGSPTLRAALLAGLHPDYPPNVVRCLQKLRESFGNDLYIRPHLALAFAFVWGRAGSDGIRAPWMGWVAKERDVPPMEVSFAHYLEHEKQMLFSLRDTPWPLLAHVADNDVPIDEREWALKRYVNRPLWKLEKLQNDPPYLDDAPFHDAVMSLPNIAENGGVCSQRSYYASRVLKTLGVPAFRLQGEGHVWPGWLIRNPHHDRYHITDYGSLGHRGGFFCPLSRSSISQYDMQLLAAAISHSYESHIQALVGFHIYEMMKNHSPENAMKLLVAAAARNPYSPTVWHAFLDRPSSHKLFSSQGPVYISRSVTHWLAALGFGDDEALCALYAFWRDEDPALFQPYVG